MTRSPSLDQDPRFQSETRFVGTTSGAAGNPSAGVESPFPNPLPGWDRYRIETLLGQGGMGQVYLAYDPELKRRAALKLMQREDMAATRRLVAEARAQARVRHENVCQVYEVGEARGKTYIAMQHIEGAPLHLAELSLEEKALALKQAAEGVQAAHRVGLIHRDIKPGNIMAARGEDGGLKAYVLDFGLARQWRQEMVTEVAAGTPHYMSPEQARGETGKLDRRTDVYSLGATLYRVLTGRPPFAGDNSLDVIRQVIDEEPQTPRQIDPAIPADLEAIALKCLEKARAARYASARELADDLERYLNGEAVLARSRSFFYRARKKLRKYRALVGAAAIALAVITMALISIINTRREAQRRERLAREFTEDVTRIEAHARFSALAPAHDIQPDLTEARRMMAGIRTAMAEAGPLGEGPGHYALGRGYLALGDDSQARAHLETSWHKGFQRPRVAYTLGIVLGRQYQTELAAVERIRNSQARAARKREIETTFRDPAVRWLALGEAAETPYPPEYGQALIAYYEGRFEEAIALISGSSESHPWFFEGPKLEGDAHLALANAIRETGDLETAHIHFDLGVAAYQTAIRIGESAPDNHYALGELYNTHLRMALYSDGDINPHFQKVLDLTEKALALDNRHQDSLLLSAYTRRLFAESLMTGKGDPSEALDQAIEAASRAMEFAPNAKGRYELGRIYRQRALFLQERGKDPRPDLERAIAVFQGIAAADRDPDYFVNLGLIYKVHGDYLATRGEDAKPFRDKAIKAYREAVSHQPNLVYGLINLGVALFQRAEKGRGPARLADLDDADRALNQALALSPKHFVGHYSLAQIHGARAQAARESGEDPKPWLEKAFASFEKAHRINGRSPAPTAAMGWIQKELGKLAWERGGDPHPYLETAVASLKTAVSLGPQYGAFHNNLGLALRQRANYLAAAGKDPGPLLAEAMAAYRETARLLPKNAIPWTNLGAAYLIQARHELDRGLHPEASLSLAQENLARAETLAGNQDFVFIAMARRSLLQGLWQAKQNQDPSQAWREAEAALDRGLELSPDNAEALLLSVRISCLRMLTQKSSTPDMVTHASSALANLERAADAGTPAGEAMAWRGVLFSLMAKISAQADQRDWETKARFAFEDALARNPNLRHAMDYFLEPNRLALARAALSGLAEQIAFNFPLAL